MPEERLEAEFGPDSVLELTPELVGATDTKNQGIIGEGVDLTLEHLQDMRPSTVLYHLTPHLLYNKYRDPGEQPKLYLFGQLKRITRQWLDGGYLRCTGGTYPGAARLQRDRRHGGRAHQGGDHGNARQRAAGQGDPRRLQSDRLDRLRELHDVEETRWQTDPRKCHINWVVCDSDWEAEFCRVAEAHPKVRAYVKNQNLGLEVPYLMGSTPRKYLPDFIVQVDDGTA